MDEKECRKCADVKPLSDFYRHPRMADGHLNICKLCKREYQRRRAKTKEGKAVERRRNQKPDRKKRLAENAKRWSEKHPKRRGAHLKVNNAVRDGRLIKPEHCESCGKIDTLHGHHEDYSKPLDVEWLCAYCHGDRHPDTIHQISIFAL